MTFQNPVRPGRIFACLVFAFSVLALPQSAAALEMHWFTPVRAGEGATIQVYGASGAGVRLNITPSAGMRSNVASCTTNFSGNFGCSGPGPLVPGTPLLPNCPHACDFYGVSTVPGVYTVTVDGDGSVLTATITVLAGPPSAATSTFVASTDGQVADGSGTDVLRATVLDAYRNPVANTTVNFAATPGVRFDGGSANSSQSCQTDASGVCSIGATSTRATNPLTGVAVTGGLNASVGYRFVPGPPSPAHSGVRVSTDGQTADGIKADVLDATVNDAFDNAVPDVSVAFDATAGVKFGTGVGGVGGSCLTAADGTCHVDATTTVPATYTTDVRLGGASLGSLSYRFVAGPADAASSGVRVVADNARADTMTSNLLEVLLRDRFGNPVAADTVAGFSAAGADVGLGNGTRGGPGSCLTVGATGICRIGATSSNPLGGSRTSVVAVGGVALAGSFVSGGLNYGPSPVVFNFARLSLPQVSGRIFDDTGVGSGVPNDGIVNGGEPGVATVAVRLTDCGSTLHAATVSDGVGSYSLSVPATLPVGAPVCVATARDIGRQSTGASISTTALAAGTAATVAGVSYLYRPGVSDDSLAFNWAGSDAAGLNFASVPHGRISANVLQNGRPGATFTFAHAFVAGTAGTVNFEVPRSVSTPAVEGWTAQVYADPGCTAELRPGAVQLFPAAVDLTMTAGQRTCVLLLLTAPIQASAGDRNETVLRARFSHAGILPTLTTGYQADDVAILSTDALRLTMEVRNVTQGMTSFGTGNQARPGEILEYRMTYTNIAQTVIRGLTIDDSTPAFTTFQGASAGALPDGLTACTKRTPASAAAPVDCAVSESAGGRGALVWRFEGGLAPGATGSVLVRVLVD